MRLPSALVWAGLGAMPDIEHLRAYLHQFPKGASAGAAQARIVLLESEAAEAKAFERLRAQETEAWGAVAASTDKARIEAFLTDWPKGQHAAAAKARIAELRRGVGRLLRGVLLGAGATATLAVAILGAYQQIQLLPIKWDVTRTVLTAQEEQALKPDGAPFRECVSCPDMVVVPAGSFVMGSDEVNNEKPPHSVTIGQPFAVGKFEVTFDEWDACVAHYARKFRKVSTVGSGG
jgi:formylglycine-generating enzyme required for sulfatase activity